LIVAGLLQYILSNLSFLTLYFNYFVIISHHAHCQKSLEMTKKQLQLFWSTYSPSSFCTLFVTWKSCVALNFSLLQVDFRQFSINADCERIFLKIIISNTNLWGSVFIYSNLQLIS